ncbi:ead/Ea22-like family protein [Salmonella enterica]|uniref:ead/Ea22-like family protein n=1 Tax=Salmonella enterica TaxID=28901 RepID=UPI0009ABCDFB|nr:ead/Ea22-like family protein [Salmonella enterica]EBT2373296.1 ead/Ea22-like family protein [Salmonella enterica]
MTIDKQALRQIAESVDREEWDVLDNGDADYQVIVSGSLERGATYRSYQPVTNEISNKKIAAFIAAFNPKVALALLDELENKQTFQHAFFRQSLMYDVVAEAYEEAKEQIAKDVEIKARLCRESNSLHDRLRAAERSIAELESKNGNLRTIAHEQNELAIRANLDSINDAVEMDSLHKHIAELEARTVTLPQRAPENLASVLDGYEKWLIATTFRDTWNACLAEVTRMNAAGIKGA